MASDITVFARLRHLNVILRAKRTLSDSWSENFVLPRMAVCDMYTFSSSSSFLPLYVHIPRSVRERIYGLGQDIVAAWHLPPTV